MECIFATIVLLAILIAFAAQKWGNASGTNDAYGKLASRFGGQRVPSADVVRCDVWPVAELRGSTWRAVERNRGRRRCRDHRELRDGRVSHVVHLPDNSRFRPQAIIAACFGDGRPDASPELRQRKTPWPLSF